MIGQPGEDGIAGSDRGALPGLLPVGFPGPPAAPAVLKQLDRLGIIESAPKAEGRGHRYQLTNSGHDLFKVCETLGEWGARWLEIAPENLDPFVALWSMCNALRRDRLPDQRVVVRFDFTACGPTSDTGC